MAAVSIQFTPAETAWPMARIESSSSWGPQPKAHPPPPTAHEPKPTVVISSPLVPSERLFSVTFDSSDAAASSRRSSTSNLVHQRYCGSPGESRGRHRGSRNRTLGAMTRTSAGILLYRRRDSVLEVLLVHPGGPFFGRKDLGNWSVPKGEVDPEDPHYEATARREFLEEVGHPVPAGRLIDLGSIRQKGGKTVYAWAIEGDFDPATMSSNFIELEWPPFSGRHKRFPEVDKWVYFGPEEARSHIKETQIPLLDRLESILRAAGADVGAGASERPPG
jgi:predicted NUDIX family NTP pyrophosphohydrolase